MANMHKPNPPLKKVSGKPSVNDKPCRKEDGKVTMPAGKRTA